MYDIFCVRNKLVCVRVLGAGVYRSSSRISIFVVQRGIRGRVRVYSYDETTHSHTYANQEREVHVVVVS